MQWWVSAGAVVGVSGCSGGCQWVQWWVSVGAVVGVSGWWWVSVGAVVGVSGCRLAVGAVVGVRVKGSKTPTLSFQKSWDPLQEH